MATKIRVKRIADGIYEELSELLLFRIKDPRLVGVNVTDVDVDRELAFADIYVSALEGEARKEEILDGLQSAVGYIRGQLAKAIQLRSFPVIRFHWDPTPERGDRIDRLLNSLPDSERYGDAAEDEEESAEDVE